MKLALPVELISKLRQACSGDLSIFGGTVVEEAAAGRVRAEQISTIKRYLPAMMLANACNACILAAALWTSPDRLSAILWACLVIAFAAFYGTKSRHGRVAKPILVSARTVQRAVRNAFLLGSLWAVLPLIFLP